MAENPTAQGTGTNPDDINNPNAGTAERGPATETADQKKAREGAEKKAAAEAAKSKNKIYELFEVEPTYEDVHDDLTGAFRGRKHTGFEKGRKLHAGISITEETAEELNSQSINTKRRYFLKG